MAIFEPAFEKTMGHEGGYSNDPNDRGGETYRGISRKNFPDWEGWEKIDASKTDHKDLLFAGELITVNHMVKEFYRKEFWEKLKCHQIPHQKVAEKIFDIGVNMGLIAPIKFLQEVLNIFNNNSKLYPDMSVDGVIGTRTLDALAIQLKRPGDMGKTILIGLDVLQGRRYMDIISRDATQEKFVVGWFNRLDFNL